MSPSESRSAVVLALAKEFPVALSPGPTALAQQVLKFFQDNVLGAPRWVGPQGRGRDATVRRAIVAENAFLIISDFFQNCRAKTAPGLNLV
jgi:hypothetical protein